METFHIHIEGQVQGVGFRPFVYKLALEWGLTGWVNNTLDGVHVEVNGSESTIREFYHQLLKKAPPLSIITGNRIYSSPDKDFHDFKIIHSNSQGETNLLLTPDFGMCSDCQEELHNPRNKRFQYPFITCTNCGPRFSIIKNLPYDRESTTMEKFVMCGECEGEYNQPLDRRYYSQTNSCCDCRVDLALYNASKKLISSEPQEIIELTAQYILQGKIIAIKGIGGYLLLADATNPQAISLLRSRKHRPTKPLALMYPDTQTLQGDILVEKDALDLMNGVQSPIVLFELKHHPGSGLVIDLIAPHLNTIGVMRPYAPLFDLLMKKIRKPVIATSGNISGSPVIFKDKNAFESLLSIADFIVTHNRDIVVPQDDSVIKFSKWHRNAIFFRRSRGFAPTYIHHEFDGLIAPILAMGAMLKSSFSLMHRENTYISQYLGDLEDFESQESYRTTLEHFFHLFKFKPKMILVDKHPSYYSTQYGEKLSTDFNVKLISVQHHEAHFAAVLAENHLLNNSDPILGVIWDGTGLGNDGQIWGGEFFTYQDYRMKRVGHIDYFTHILGDKMPKEPRVSALSLAHKSAGSQSLLEPKFTELEWGLYHRILESEPSLQTSSVGRLFDGVASLLGIADFNSYEGEAAMWLESIAGKYIYAGNFDRSSYLPTKQPNAKHPIDAIINGIIRDINCGLESGYIASKFHFSLVDLIENCANSSGVNKIAFSGGVFQNTLLVDLILERMHQGYDLYFHQKLSPNDECISFGQIARYLIDVKRGQLYQKIEKLEELVV